MTPSLSLTVPMSRPRRGLLRLPLLLLLPVVLTTSGCFTPDIDLRSRAALEQQLLSAALDRAVARVNLPPGVGGNTLVVVRGPEGIDRDLIAMAIQKRLAKRDLPSAPEQFSRRLEVWTRVFGNDSDQDLVGVPIPIGVNTIDLGLYSRNMLWGRVHLSLVVRTPAGQIQWQSAEVEGNAYFGETTYLTLMGPFPSTDIPNFKRPRPAPDTPSL